MTSTSFTKDQPAEILSDERGVRLVRLDFYHDSYGGTYEHLAQLAEGLVTLTHMSNDHKPKKFMLDPNSMTRLAVAWLAFMDDCQTKEDAEKAKFQAETNLVKERAKAIGAIMTDYAPESNYGTFNLAWPVGHPLERFNRHWTHGNENLDISSVQDRLKHVEEHAQEAQIEAVENPRHISDYEQQVRRAHEVGGFLTSDSDDEGARQEYSLSFAAPHHFATFWRKGYELTAGQVEYRLNYVEGVMQQQALQK